MQLPRHAGQWVTHHVQVLAAKEFRSPVQVYEKASFFHIRYYLRNFPTTSPISPPLLLGVSQTAISAVCEGKQSHQIQKDCVDSAFVCVCVCV
jgi:hypothetical protein